MRVRDGVVRDVRPGLAPERGEDVLEAAGRWAIPGLWDAHVHLQQWAQARERIDLSGTASADEVVARVAAHLARVQPARPHALVSGYGYRSATWDRPPTVAELDRVSGPHPVVLVSGDAHNGWLNSRAQQLLGLAPRPGPLEEAEWFAVLTRLGELGDGSTRRASLAAAQRDAAAKGVVGVVDMEFEAGVFVWPQRVEEGHDLLRVRAATYPDRLEEVLRAGLRTGDPVPGGRGLVTAGPLKIIFDGSLNTGTAYCCAPYRRFPDSTPGRGVRNLAPDELARLCRRAAEHGVQVAVHAIGDAAVREALDAIEYAGTRGSVEHAQLVAREDLPRFGRLGVRASVQPAHLLDDRDVTERLWPDRADRCFPLASLLGSGAALALGSDAPVAPLDPWLAMAAAVHRSADEREPWNPAEALAAAQALAASTDGAGTVAPGQPGDLVLLDADPLAGRGGPPRSPRTCAGRPSRPRSSPAAPRTSHSDAVRRAPRR